MEKCKIFLLCNRSSVVDHAFSKANATGSKSIVIIIYSLAMGTAPEEKLWREVDKFSTCESNDLPGDLVKRFKERLAVVIKHLGVVFFLPLPALTHLLRHPHRTTPPSPLPLLFLLLRRRRRRITQPREADLRLLRFGTRAPADQGFLHYFHNAMSYKANYFFKKVMPIPY